MPPDAIKLGTAKLLGMQGVVPRNPIITKAERDAVLVIETGMSLKQALPFERMVDNSFVEKATAAFGLPS